MTEEKGILDDIEELVSDFSKKKSSLLLKNFDKNYCRAKLSSFEEYYKNRYTNEYYFKQEYPIESDYNKKIKYSCKCGINYIIYINQVETMVDRDYIINSWMLEQNINIFEKGFFCVKCGKKCYVRMNSAFEIVLIKHEESLKI